jgi:hypothetical protein
MRVPSLLAFTTLLLLPTCAVASSPKCWQLAGDEQSCYQLDRDVVVTHAGKPSGRLMSLGDCQSYGTMVQCIEPADYAGKRVRFSAYVKALSVKEWAGLWMRVDGDGGCGTALAFDNMNARPIKGTKDWARYEIVLDVAKEARSVCLGLLLRGTGEVWLSGVSFEVVSAVVPTTVADGGLKQKQAILSLGH